MLSKRHGEENAKVLLSGNIFLLIYLRCLVFASLNNEFQSLFGGLCGTITKNFYAVIVEFYSLTAQKQYY